MAWRRVTRGRPPPGHASADTDSRFRPTMTKRCSSRWTGPASWPKPPSQICRVGTITSTDAFTDYVTVFNIRPAQCELLFPVVTALPETSEMSRWETAISVTNPAYEEEMAAGGLTFTFYGMDNVVATYDTTVDPITGVGLEADGTLSPGGTYQVLASEILKATNWGESFEAMSILGRITPTVAGWVG